MLQTTSAHSLINHNCSDIAEYDLALFLSTMPLHKCKDTSNSHHIINNSGCEFQPVSHQVKEPLKYPALSNISQIKKKSAQSLAMEVNNVYDLVENFNADRRYIRRGTPISPTKGELRKRKHQENKCTKLPSRNLSMWGQKVDKQAATDKSEALHHLRLSREDLMDQINSRIVGIKNKNIKKHKKSKFTLTKSKSILLENLIRRKDFIESMDNLF